MIQSYVTNSNTTPILAKLRMLVVGALSVTCGACVLTEAPPVCLTDTGIKVSCPGYTHSNGAVMQREEHTIVAGTPTAMQQAYFERPPSYLVLSDYANSLAEKLSAQIGDSYRASELAITPFVWFDHSLKRTGPLGQQFAELLLNSLRQQSFDVIDTVVTGEYALTSSGLRVFSRTEHNEKIIAAAQHALVGTMLPSDDGIVVNARIVDVNSGRVQATHSFILPKILFR